MKEIQTLPPEYFEREDTSSDHDFYAVARKVVHIDQHAIEKLRGVYEEILPREGTLLDLMSSWRSHLPHTLNSQRVIGLGMNSDEMDDNPQLDEHIIHSLNDLPTVPYHDNFFDGAMCAVSVQYLTQPVKVFREVNRVLKPGAPFVVSFSNRCFPSKAVAVWLSGTDEDHVELVKKYFALAGNYTRLTQHSFVKRGHDPLYVVSAYKFTR